MKTNLISALVLLVIFLSACTAPRYVPKTQDLDVNVYGSYIMIKPLQGTKVNGELLAVDTNRLTVLMDSGKQKKVSFIPLKEVKGFTLQYARPKSYWWSVGTFTALCISHGVWAAVTIPVNLIITAGIALGANNDFKYHKDDITYDQLKIFARFPQGIPADVVLNTKPQIKPRFMPHKGPGKK
ncbi:MAG: hypothetical protein NTX61_16760 [Bacteroidetes bacterium]|nr:hypothetical protein [Bacteroidota bacterium]